MDTLDTHGATTVGIACGERLWAPVSPSERTMDQVLVRRVDIVPCGKAKHRADKNNQQVQRVDAQSRIHSNKACEFLRVELHVGAFYPLNRLGFPTGARFCRPSPSTPIAGKQIVQARAHKLKAPTFAQAALLRDAQCSRPGHRARQ